MRRLVWGVLGVAVLGAVAVAAFNTLSATPLQIERFRWPLLLAGVLGFLALQVLHGGLWLWILRLMHVRVPTLWGFSIWCTSILARYVPSGALMPIVRAALAERGGVRKPVCLASSVYELTLAIVGALIVGAYFFVELPALRGEPGRFLALVIPVAALIALHPRIFGSITSRALKRLGRDPLPETLGVAPLATAAVAYATTFVVGGLATLAVVLSLEPVALADAPTVIGAFSVAYVASVLAFVLPAGIGAREAALTAALSPVIPAATALLAAVMIRLIQMVLEVSLAPAMHVLVGRRGAGVGPDAGTASAGPSLPDGKVHAR